MRINVNIFRQDPEAVAIRRFLRATGGNHEPFML